MRNWKYVIAAAAIGLAAFLLYRTLSRYSLDQLIVAVTAVPVPRLLGAAGFAAASYLSLTFFDYLALHYVKRRCLIRRRPWPPSPPCLLATTSDWPP
jgi:glycosyltransferase 2 family protein